MKHITKHKKPLQAPNLRERKHDEQRFKHCDDERLSGEAGYGRGDSVPNPKD